MSHTQKGTLWAMGLLLMIIVVLILISKYHGAQNGSYTTSEKKSITAESVFKLFENATLLTPQTNDQVTLDKGIGTHQIIPGSASVGTLIASEKFNALWKADSGRTDFAILLRHNTGGSGTFHYLVLYDFSEGKFTKKSEVFLGDRVDVTHISIDTLRCQGDADYRLNVKFLTHGKGQGMADDPTDKKNLSFYINEQNFEQSDDYFQPRMTVKGMLTLGHEAYVFKPCGSDKSYWIHTDNSGMLRKSYRELTQGETPYSSIFAEITVVDKGKSKEGFLAEYDGAYRAINVLKTAKQAEKNCNNSFDKTLDFNRYICLLQMKRNELIEALAEEPTYITEGGLKFSKTKIRVWFDQYQRVSQVYTINKSVDFKGVQIEDDISKFRNIFGKTTMENTISASVNFDYKGLVLHVSYDPQTKKTVAATLMEKWE